MRAINILLTSLIVIVFTAPQIAPGAVGGQVSVQFRVLALDRTFADVTFQSGGKYQSFGASYGSIGGMLSYTGPNPMLIYRAVVVNGKEEARSVGEVAFPGPGRYLVVLNGSSGGRSVSGVAVPDNAGAVPERHMRIINATPIPLIVDCNDDKDIALRSGDSKVVNLGNAVRGDVYVRANRQGSMVDLTNNIYTNVPGLRRTLIIVLNNVEEMRQNPQATPSVDILNLSETPPASRGR